ncbi:MAG: ABC transporter ATP-binding protein [Longimicrobiales bacterium]|nr:ABC transporter ATP-binding protein [Longimicrobiales bacterium]
MLSADADVALSLLNLRKSFGGLEAVRDLSLDVFRGEVFGFLGPNGAGKTTTIRMICGLLRADSGEIRVDGAGLRENVRDARRRIGLCPQELVIWETLTCLEQLVFVGTQYDLGRREARRRSLELLDVLGLSEKRNRLAKTLSGGMKRRLNLALALVHDPELLVLDEPQAGLDPQSRVLVREYILSLAREKTVILTTHEMDEADRLAGRVGIIDHGRLLVLDTPACLKEKHAGGDILEISIGEERDGLPGFLHGLPGELTTLESLPGKLRLTGPALHDRIAGLFRNLESAGIEVRDVTLRKPTLEDVFITLTGKGLRE